MWFAYSFTVAELAKIYAGLVQDKDSDGYGKLCVKILILLEDSSVNSTILKIGKGKVLLKKVQMDYLVWLSTPDYQMG